MWWCEGGRLGTVFMARCGNKLPASLAESGGTWRGTLSLPEPEVLYHNQMATEKPPHHNRSQKSQNRTLLQPEQRIISLPRDALGMLRLECCTWNAVLGVLLDGCSWNAALGMVLEWCWNAALLMVLDGCSWNGAGGVIL